MTNHQPLSVSHVNAVMTVRSVPGSDGRTRKFKNESAFWYALKKTLTATRYPFFAGETPDLVKKVMGKDGHMVGGDGYPYYLRDRKWRFCIHDTNYALRDLAEELHKKGVVVLTIQKWET